MACRRARSASCAPPDTKPIATSTWRSTAGSSSSIPEGGFYFVFVAGVPIFRKYDAARASLIFERHIEGIELDDYMRTPANDLAEAEQRRTERRHAVRPVVRAAAADASGRLWISLDVPYTYVYDRQRRQAPRAYSSGGRHHFADEPVVHAVTAPAGNAGMLHLRWPLGRRTKGPLALLGQLADRAQIEVEVLRRQVELRRQLVYGLLRASSARCQWLRSRRSVNVPASIRRTA